MRSEVGTNIESVEGNREEGMTGTEMARGRQGGVDAQDEVERGGASVIWASTSARNLDVGAGRTRNERGMTVSGKRKPELQHLVALNRVSQPPRFGSEEAAVGRSTPLCFDDFNR